jgi:hypothetical protein
MRNWSLGAGGLALGLLLAACGAASHPSPSPTVPSTPLPSPTQSPTPPSSPTTASATSCSTSQLQVTLANGQGAAGSVIYSLQFQNTGPSSCTLFGNPGVSLVASQSGPQLGAAATFVNHSQAVTVTLAPGATASASLQIAEAGNFPQSSCDEAPAAGLRVYPPGQTRSLFVAQSGLQACRDAGAQLLQVGPVTG